MAELELGKLKIKIETDGTAEASKDLKKIQDELKTAEEASKKAGENAKKIAKTAAGAITALTTAMLAASASTQRYREDMAKLETAFEKTGKNAEVAKETYNGFYAILGESDRSVEAVNHLSQLCDTEHQLAEWTDICAGVTATFGDSLPIEGLTEAANETAKVAQVTGPLADALNWVGISEDGFNEALKKCNSEQERATLITNTLTKAYKQTGQEYKNANADVIEFRKAQSELNDAMAEVGATVQPVLTDCINAVSGYVKQKIPEIKELLQTTGDIVVKFIDYISEHGDEVVGTITAIGGAYAGWQVAQTIGNVIVAIKGYYTALKTAEATQKSFNATLNANPYVAVASLITALVGALISYSIATKDAEDSTRNYKKELKEVQKEIEETEKTTNDALKTDLAKIATTEQMFDRLLELDNELKANSKNTEENKNKKAELKALVDKLNSISPAFQLAINNETGSLKNQASQVEALSKKYIELAKAKAYAAAIEDKMSDLYKQKMDLEDIKTGAESEIKKIEKRTSSSNQYVNPESWEGRIASKKNNLDLKEQKETISDANAQIKAIDKKIEKLAKDGAKQSIVIDELSGIFETTTTTNTAPYTQGYDSYSSSSAGSGSGKSTSNNSEEKEKTVQELYETDRQWLDDSYELGKLTFTDYVQGLKNIASKYYADGTIEFKHALDYVADIVSDYEDEQIRGVQDKLGLLNLRPDKDKENVQNQYQLWLLMHRDATDEEKTQKHLETLNKSLEKDNAKRDNLIAAYDDMVEITGENSEETLELRNAITELDITMQETKNTIQDIEDAEKKQAQQNALYGFNLRHDLVKGGMSYKDALDLTTSAGYGISTIQVNQVFNAPTATPSQVQNATKKGIRDMEVELQL